jgi:hypothetical protein
MHAAHRTATLAALAVALPVLAQELKIENLLVLPFEDAPAAAAGQSFLTGAQAYFRFEIRGYRKIEKNDDEFVQLAWEMEVTDTAGVPITEPKNGKIAKQIFPQDKGWKPVVRQEALIPPLGPSGEYRVRVRVRDEYANAAAAAEARFAVRGRDVEPSDTMAVRNFRFLRSNEDREALREAVYARGSTLWARFDMTGYRLAEGNRYDVEYAIAILDAAGRELYSQPEPAVESGQSFYPRRYTPGALSLDIDRDTAVGKYTLVLRVKDRISGQTAEWRQGFAVE